MPETQSSRTPASVPGSAAASVVEFFNRRAEDYDREYNDESPGGFALRVRRHKVMQLFDKPGGNVLDVGCGPGVMTDVVVERGCNFWGIDPSSRMIDIARNRYPEDAHVHFLQGDAMQLALPDEFFDAVICMGVIDALQDRELAVREMLRVLKPSGTLLITFTNFYSPYASWKNYIFYPLVARWHSYRARRGDPMLKPERMRHGRIRALYTPRKAAALLQSAGTKVESITGYYYNVLLSPLDELAPKLALRVTEKLERRVWPRPDWLAAGFILKVQKV